VQWGPRTLDIDILSYHDEIHAHMAQIPHSRLAARAFVLYPLRDIAPGWRHPISGVGVSTLIQRLPVGERRGIVKIN
jgi:2-amino-4-hydroxy-6-hydroxymethyldihydropteridine diphosphokinase